MVHHQEQLLECQEQENKIVLLSKSSIKNSCFIGDFRKLGYNNCLPGLELWLSLYKYLLLCHYTNTVDAGCLAHNTV